MATVRAVAVRLAVLVGSLLVASFVVFAVCQALPGDVAQQILGEQATPEAVDALRQRLGLDRPFLVRYAAWVGGMLSGDFGSSYLTGVPVGDLIWPRVAVSAWLIGLALLLTPLVALPLGLVAAVWRRHWQGFVATAASQVGMAIPAFWTGLMLVSVFSIRLGWLPANGYVAFAADPAGWASHLVLPVASLTIVQAAMLTRYVRSAFVEVLTEDYFRTARAIGWRRIPGLLRHGLRNVALSVLTVLGLQLAATVVGAIVIESVFTLPGLGSLLLTAVGQRDLQVVQGTVMLLVVTVLVINALVDVSYQVLDPRVRTGDLR
ncbi:ABC transporter permease [Propionicicella superfundia]|uniref:ABC transporter permease n=1 Tax=Propionicicella superfundia TaxID=348582 RepID=UPI00042A7D87|nr:ABC transporter permease [Propionicicella superfundia]